MHPAFSIVLFTTLIGAAQGLVVTLATATLLGIARSGGFAREVLLLAEVLLIIGLISSFFHLGRPARAWRSALMWRTSWMSREVIVLPAFIGLVGLWWIALRLEVPRFWTATGLPALSIAGAFLLWYCTAMIYACIRFIQEWAHPLTIVNYALIGLSSGLVMTCALSALAAEEAMLRAMGPWAFGATAVAWLTRAVALRRNARLRPRSTLQSATGIQARKLVQKSMGMTGGAFNTREFFHGASMAMMKRAKIVFQVLAFAVPLACMLPALSSGWTTLWSLASAVQLAGLLVERWFFFAQARHPQNLYYQVVS